MFQSCLFRAWYKFMRSNGASHVLARQKQDLSRILLSNFSAKQAFKKHAKGELLRYKNHI